MTTIPVLWISRHDDVLARGYADQGLLEAILARSAWRPPGAFTFEHHEIRQGFPDVDGAVVVFNARTHTLPEDVDWIHHRIAELEWAVVIFSGDEEWAFPWQDIHHPNMRRWAMQARPEHEGVCTPLPGGWYPGTHDHLAGHDGDARPLDWFFAGQVTHDRRVACVEQLRQLAGGELHETAGYLQEAIPRAEYFDRMAHAKVVPCPSGPYSVDCARTFEALEAGCVPIADLRSVYGPDFDYWTLLFGPGHGIPTIADWVQLPHYLADTLTAWPGNANRVFARWQQYKRQLAHRLDEDIRTVSGLNRDLDTPDDQVTVIVTTSPVPANPSTEHIATTIDSIREQLPTAEIVIVADGIRPEQEDQRGDYDEYVRRLLWRCNFEWLNVVPVVLEEWGHQANATRAALELVTTPLVLFVEHDTPIEGEIEWGGLCTLVASGAANVVQFYENVEIHPDHEEVLLDRDLWPAAVPVRRTSAWWQRPHLASTRFYRECVMGHFPLESRTMIEDHLYPLVSGDIAVHGEPGWWDWRLFLYTPPGNTRRSGHLDSRGDQPKWPMAMEYRPPRKKRRRD